MSGLTVNEAVDIIRQSPNEILVTVRPVTSVHKALKKDFSRINYSDIVHFKGERNGGAVISDGSHSNGMAHSNGGSCDDAEYAVVDKYRNPHREVIVL